MTTQRSPTRVPPVALVIFGASGDLTARKLLPALASLAGEGSLPEGFGLVGVARTPWSDNEFRDHCLAAVPDAKPPWAELAKRFRYVIGDYDDDACGPGLFDRLVQRIDRVTFKHRTAQRKIDDANVVLSLKRNSALNGSDYLAVGAGAVLIKYAKVDDVDIGSHADDLLGIATA